jgi:aerobic-type carbon monoxide dehydrogenase small subunit (CoxS/CutS family)
MELHVNHRRYSVDTERDRSLLSVLREELELTGPKYGCGEGQCGACTVSLDGVNVHSCVTPVGDAAGKHVLTVEGLVSDGHLLAVQEAFLEADALQCGYCTSGMVMGAVELLSKNPHPSRPEIIHAVQGHICRCGAYPRIVHAVEIAASRHTEAPHA